MQVQYILSEYIEKALGNALYDKLEDGTYSGRIPDCIGVIAFGKTLRECEIELRSTFEEWILLGLKLNHYLPIIDSIDLNKEPAREKVDTV
jgi:predicted RNase H-like HicB family nuclease